ncbi:MAG TPA: hypothetical protein DCQ30_04390 [Acidimicrobiaceae bacterium]|nr:hypothetical protein [Acidimicrobiaceae bacterium]
MAAADLASARFRPVRAVPSRAPPPLTTIGPPRRAPWRPQGGWRPGWPGAPALRAETKTHEEERRGTGRDTLRVAPSAPRSGQ